MISSRVNEGHVVATTDFLGMNLLPLKLAPVCMEEGMREPGALSDMPLAPR